jgi:hypothetical protein
MKTKKQLTAVEWLKFQINSIQFQDPAAEELYLEIQPLIEQAKENVKPLNNKNNESKSKV